MDMLPKIAQKIQLLRQANPITMDIAAVTAVTMATVIVAMEEAQEAIPMDGKTQGWGPTTMGTTTAIAMVGHLTTEATMETPTTKTTMAGLIMVMATRITTIKVRRPII